MATRNWKRAYPHSLRNAMELCVEYARQKKNLSVERIADLMGLESHFTLYKWMANSRMPSLMVRPFENACGIDFITQYLAHSNNKLLIPMPTGRTASPEELNDLTLAMHETGAQLLKYYNGVADAEEVVGLVTALMERLGHHRANIEKDKQPELELS